jgi:tetratricopeptide (TPR) repeat protein
MQNKESSIKRSKEALEQRHGQSYDNECSRIEFAREYRKKGLYDRAIEELNIVLQQNPFNGSIYHDLGWNHHDSKDYVAALKDFKNALKCGFDNIDVRWGLARTYREKKEYDKAINELNFVLKRYPSDSRTYYRLGWIYRENGQYELSTKAFRKVSKTKPYDYDPFLKNKILNEIEISQKKTILKSKPLVLGVTLSHACNIKCKMCDVWKKPWDIPEKIVQEISGYLPSLKYLLVRRRAVYL